MSSEAYFKPPLLV